MALGNIRNSISKNADALKEGGVAALGTLILGGSKAEAALAGVGQAIATKLLGPLGKFVGVAAMATKGIYAMTKAWATMGTGAASKLETVQNQLRVMLKGLDAAKQRVRELRNFAIVTPFKMGDIVQGNRALESLSRGALTTTKAMTMVGDAAAQAGVGFEDMAVYVGRLYDGLAGGRPVGEVLFRLAELGVISGQARTSLEALQESGAGFSAVWNVVEGELKRSAGTMGYTSKTLEGLQSTLEDTQDELKATFSGNFLEGQKEAISAQIKTMENLKPAVEGLGKAFGGMVTVLNTWSAKLLAVITSFKVVGVVVESVIRLLAGMSAAVLALGAASGTLTVLTMVFGNMRKSVLAVGAAFRWLTAVMLANPFAILVVGIGSLIAMWTAHNDRVQRARKEMEEYERATDSLLSKLQQQINSIRTLDQLSAAYSATLSEMAVAYREYAAAAAEYEEGKGGDGRFVDFGQMERSLKKMEQMQVKLNGLKSKSAALDAMDRGGLESSPAYADAQKNLLANERAEEEARREVARMQMTPGQRAQSLGAEADDLAARRGQAITEIGGQEKHRKNMEAVELRKKENLTAQSKVEASMGMAMNADPERYAKLAEELSKLRAEELALASAAYTAAQAQGSEIVKLQEAINIYNAYGAQVTAVEKAKDGLREAQSGEEQDEKKRSEAIQAASAALYEQEQRLTALKGAYDAAGMSAAKVQEAQGRIEVIKQQSGQDILNRPDEIRKRAEAQAAARGLVSTRLEEQGAARAQLAGETGGDYAQAKEQLVTERARLELQRQYKEIDDDIYFQRKAVLESQERMLERERSKRNETAQGELKVQKAQEDGGALAAAEAQLRIDLKQLKLANQRGEIEDSIYAKKKAALASEQRVLAQRKAMAVAENAAGVASGQKSLEAKVARLSGRGAEARRLEEEAARLQEDAGRERRIREIMDSTGASRADAEQQAGGEIGRARLDRGLDREGGLLSALLGRGQVVDSMQRIGGGGGVSTGPDIKKVIDRLDKLIQAVQAQGQGTAAQRIR